MEKVYVVEDNTLVRKGIEEYFEISGFEVDSFETIADTREAFTKSLPDVLILDVMLPDGNGFQFAKELRVKYSQIPIIFLTAKEEESDRIMGFEVGGDDYVVKPFSNKELLLRVKALLRRASNTEFSDSEKDSSIKLSLDSHYLIIDQLSRKAYLDDCELHFTATEWNILIFLAERANQAISRDVLLEDCLGYLYSGSERTIDTHIASIRAILGPGDWIETIRGFGYRCAAIPVTKDHEE